MSMKPLRQIPQNKETPGRRLRGCCIPLSLHPSQHQEPRPGAPSAPVALGSPRRDLRWPSTRRNYTAGRDGGARQSSTWVISAALIAIMVGWRRAVKVDVPETEADFCHRIALSSSWSRKGRGGGCLSLREVFFFLIDSFSADCSVTGAAG